MRRQESFPTDRYLPLRQDKKTFNPHVFANCSETASTVSTHLQLLHTSPPRTLSFTQTSKQASVCSFAHKHEIKGTIKKQENPNNKEVHCDRIIDATGVVNEFFYNCIDGSAKDFLAIGLEDQCYLCNQKMCLQVFNTLCYGNFNESCDISCVKFN